MLDFSTRSNQLSVCFARVVIVSFFSSILPFFLFNYDSLKLTKGCFLTILSLNRVKEYVITDIRTDIFFSSYPLIEETNYPIE